MSGIVWLASYPKSGNTWTRVFLSNYWRNSDTPADINDLNKTPIASARGVFDEHTGVNSGDLTMDEIDYYRPGVYIDYASTNEETQYCKIHDAYTFLPDGRPIFPPKATRSAIYIIRNPLDVAVSYANHNGCSIAKSVKMMCDDTHGLCKTTRGQTNQLRQIMLSWSGHVQSWTEVADLSVHVMRYEDMTDYPVDTFTKVVQFIGGDDDHERVSRAVEFSSFDKLQKQESEQGFREKMPHSSAFFKKGKKGSWRESLNDEQIEKIIESHGDVMRKFGYLNSENEILF